MLLTARPFAMSGLRTGPHFLTILVFPPFEASLLLCMLWHLTRFASPRLYAPLPSFHSGVNSIVSERALQEIYMAPFRAGVRAGVASAMCSYNLVNGTHACGMAASMNANLKGDLEWPGFITSDWAAVVRSNYCSFARRDQRSRARRVCAAAAESSPTPPHTTHPPALRLPLHPLPYFLPFTPFAARRRLPKRWPRYGSARN